MTWLAAPQTDNIPKKPIKSGILLGSLFFVEKNTKNTYLTLDFAPEDKYNSKHV